MESKDIGFYTMKTIHQFFESKGVKSMKETITIHQAELWMEEYCRSLLFFAAEKVKKKEVEIPSGLKIITTEIDKESITNLIDKI
jgi:hypothetical protein